MQNEEVSRLVLQATGRSFLSAAKELCAEAMIQGSTDNVTALVIDLRYACCLHLPSYSLSLFWWRYIRLSLYLLINFFLYLSIQESFIIHSSCFHIWTSRSGHLDIQITCYLCHGSELSIQLCPCVFLIWKYSMYFVHSILTILRSSLSFSFLFSLSSSYFPFFSCCAITKIELGTSCRKTTRNSEYR